MQFVEANGARIPAIGLGTWELRGRTCARLVEQALKLGYRHIDTAQAYDNECEVGDGLRASRVRRDEVFVTTKVWTTHFAPNDLERSAKESLTKLRLSEVDLLLLHWPNPQVPLQETLGALAQVKKLGMCRHIGVSNFTVALIEEAVAACSEPLVCDQVEYHPHPDQHQVNEPRRPIRPAIAASATGHLTILTAVLIFTEVHPFGTVTAEPITVDIVSPDEAAKKAEPIPTPKTEPSDPFDLSSKSAPSSSPAPA